MCPNRPSTFVCGTPRSAEDRTVEMTEGAIDPCLVCFGGATITCNRCGSELITRQEATA